MKTSRHLSHMINMYLMNAFDLRTVKNASFIMAKYVDKGNVVHDIQMNIHTELAIQKYVEKIKTKTI